MSSVNKVTLVGRLGQDPETKQVGDTTVANFSLATSETWKDKDGEKQEKTEWHRLVAWGRQAEIIGKYLNKGSLIYIEGQLQTRKWEKDGVDRYTTEIRVGMMKMLGGHGANGSGNDSSEQNSSESSSEPAAVSAGGGDETGVPF